MSALHRVPQTAGLGFVLASTSQGGQVLHQMATCLDLESLSTRRWCMAIHQQYLSDCSCQKSLSQNSVGPNKILNRNDEMMKWWNLFDFLLKAFLALKAHPFDVQHMRTKVYQRLPSSIRSCLVSFPTAVNGNHEPQNWKKVWRINVPLC